MRRALIWLVTGLLLGLLAAPTSHAAPPRAFFGMTAWTDPGADEFQRMGAGKVGTFRVNFSWRSVEPTPGERHWDRYDPLLRDASQAGVRVLPVILSSPSFAAKQSGYPPRSKSAKRSYVQFVKDLVGRYGRNGSFWRTNSGPDKPPTAWQVWNEPSHRAYWTNGKPNARQYAAFLKLTRKAIKSRDRRAKIVLGGLPETKTGIGMVKYLKSLYRVKRVKRLFDVVAIHPYAASQRGVEGALIRVRRLMRRRRDSRTPIWITEVGWATDGPSRNKPRFVAGVSGQADRLDKTFHLAVRKRKKYRLGMIVWFSWRDRKLQSGEADWWAPHTGLFDVDGDPRPAWRTYTSFTRGSPGSGRLASSGSGGGGSDPGAGGGSGGDPPKGGDDCNVIIICP